MTEILESPLSLQRLDLKSGEFITTRDITTASETKPSLLEALTLPEKVSLLSGSSFVTASGIKRLGLPALKTVDTVCGVKGSQTFDGVKTLCFPSTGCVGATWNRDLVHKMGVALARQAKSKAAQVVLGPAMNIHRDPRAGRNFECFSEDPLVTGLLAASMVNGIQSGGVASCPKHFVANDSETKRRFYDVKESVDGRAIREIYLGAFQTMMRFSDPMSLMTAYNKLDGEFASENIPLIKNVLREQWGYQGCLISDWYGTRSGLPALNAGLDLEMPGPSVFRGASLVDDVASGRVSESLIDERVTNVLKLIERTKPSHSDATEESLLDEPACQLAREIATEGIVLLQNRKAVLPLKMEKVAVIGGSSLVPAIGGGGSAEAPPQYIIRPLDSIRKSHTTPEHVSSHSGVKIHNALPMIPSDQMYAMDGSSGIDIQYFNNGKDTPVHSERLAKPHVIMLGRVRSGLNESEFHYTISTCLVAKTSGTHTIGIQATGNFVLEVNEKKVLHKEMKGISVEDFLFKPKYLERTCDLPMVAGIPYFLKLTVQNHPGMGTGEPCVHAAKLCYMEAYSNDALIDEAVSIARAADVSIIFAGRTAEHESEGFDLQDIKLPETQINMIKAVAAGSKRSVLVLSGGNPIDVQDFVDDVDAILFTHFLGQESGPALAEILYGKCPSGRLATTWPKTLEDSPSFAHFPAKETSNGFEISYAEGINIGYRSSMIAQWPFGFGLSYTTFNFSDLRITRREQTFVVQLTVTNSGTVAGSDVVQVYVTELAPSIDRPKELKAFTKLHLEPTASTIVELCLDINHSFSAWSEQEKLWLAEAGDYRIDVGSLTGTVNLQQAIRWSGL